MRLLSVHIIEAETCGSLLKDFRVGFRPPGSCTDAFAPVCLIGRNGAGKSQFMQVIAEMFQAAFYAVVPTEERADGNEFLQFELIYALRPPGEDFDVHVRISRKSVKLNRKPKLKIERLVGREWEVCNLSSFETVNLLPEKVVGYSSGDNETLSLPFLLSRSGYADDVTNAALKKEDICGNIPDTRLMLIDYGTHLEVLVANLLLGGPAATEDLLAHARLKRLHSFRCVVQLRHGAVRSLARGKGVQVTDELNLHIQRLRDCATCYHYEAKDECYTLDFLVNEATTEAFGAFWESALSLYSALHKLAMLMDLAFPRDTRRRFARDTKKRRFASRLPEPQDEEKVFRFASVRFTKDEAVPMVDYVSLSDGEHQLAQVLGTFRMISSPNVLFLLDEPESHFNPQWRVKFVSGLLGLETSNGNRTGDTGASQQDALLTTHAPFVPCDLPRDRVLIFRKDNEAGKIVCDRPRIETKGSEFDAILQDCFGVSPPISDLARQEIEIARQNDNPDEIRATMDKLGYSTEKALLADRLRQLTNP